MFCSDYPRRVVNCIWLWCFPAFDALPVAPALTIPFLLAHRRLPVSLFGLSGATISVPPPGIPRRSSAGVPAVGESAPRTPSADTAASAADGAIASADPLDFRDDL